ncbi:glutathione S-transferase [Rhodobacterales bacterium 52_120_T64]|nr:glutathione S-transferase [Rhodobacterales bacterium 52_120_T64]
MYKVIGTSRNRTMRVYWALEEMGLDYEMVLIPPRSEEVRAFNPSGKVPCLLVDGEAIIDSVAIIQFLADKHGKMTFPAGTIKRAQQDSFTQFCVDEIEGALWTAAKNSFIHPEERRVPDIKPTAKYEFANAMKTLETRLGDNEFVMGDTFTIPDLLLGHCANWAMGAKFDLPEGPVGEYLKRITSRSAYQRAKDKTGY